MIGMDIHVGAHGTGRAWRPQALTLGTGHAWHRLALDAEEYVRNGGRAKPKGMPACLPALARERE